MFIAEEVSEPGDEVLFEQNIADTVIRLSSEKRDGNAQRYIEIMKSRLQREQGGLHPFSILPGVGINIFPSTAAVNTRIRNRSIRVPDTPIRFGLPSLDNIFGKDAITAGDLIVFKGQGGTFKTHLGLLFLFGSDLEPAKALKRRSATDLAPHLRPCSLLIAARDSEITVQHMLSQTFVQRHIKETSPSKSIEDIRVCVIQGSNVTPGYIIQRIEDEFFAARADGYWIDRVMIDNVAHWEMSCPFIKADDTFGDMLSNFLRSYQVTSLLICGDVSDDRSSSIQRSIIDDADTTVQFNQFEFRGLHRVMIRVVKTRSMRHSGELYQLTFTGVGFDVDRISPLLRVGQGGEVTPINIRLLLHVETDMQQRYNDRFLDILKGVLSHEIKVESQDVFEVKGSRRLAKSSSVDELQIIQLDEFQVPDMAISGKQDTTLHNFPTSLWYGREWGDFMPVLVNRVRSNQRFFAIPYYENIALLAYRNSDSRITEAVKSWGNLSEECVKWEEENEDTTSLFFDYPHVSKENYNSLFFEIFLSLQEDYEALKTKPGSNRFNLYKWLHAPTILEAAKIFRRLCRRSYFLRFNGGLSNYKSDDIKKNIQVDPQAIVWRHWYTTLNQTMANLTLEERKNISIAPLPSHITVAGEWYLAVPSYSAAPNVGLEVIKLLTSHEAEIDRMLSGVGLPTRQTFYEHETEKSFAQIPISPYLSMSIADLSKIISNAFRRSNIDGYALFSPILAYHLQRIIEIPEDDDLKIEKAICDVLASLEAGMRFMWLEQN